MREQKETVFEFLGRVGANLPNVTTVERTTNSKYLFYLVVRHYRKRSKGSPQFFTFSKAEAGAVQGTIEEHRIFEREALYVLEGFSQNFVDRLLLPPDTYVLAETDGGQLTAPLYSYQQRRDILRLLLAQLNVSLSLRELLKLDWSSMRSYEEYEPLLRKARVMEWTEEDLAAELRILGSGNVLTLMKRRREREILEMTEKYGSRWMAGHVLSLLTEAIHYRALILMGYDEKKCGREMGLGWRRLKDLEEITKMLTLEDLDRLTERYLQLDHLIQRNPSLGMELFFLGQAA